MQDIEPRPAHLQQPGQGQPPGPFAPVGIAPHRLNRGDFLQGCQHPEVANIPGVDDELHPPEDLGRLWPQQPVGVGDDADEMLAQAHR